MSFEIKDNKGRVIAKVNDKGRIVVARHPDLDDKSKEYHLKLYGEITDESVEELEKFLNYEEDDDEFCV